MIKRILLAAAVGTALFVGGCGHPSDGSIIRRFYSDKSAYERLSVMALQDNHLWRVAQSWYRTTLGANFHKAKNGLLSSERWKRYRDLFAELDLGDGVSIDDGNVYFLVDSMGIVGSGSTKGIAFISLKDKIQSSSDDASHGITYKQIEGNWFIFRDW
jgi:hypothetical protein